MNLLTETMEQITEAGQSVDSIDYYVLAGWVNTYTEDEAYSVETYSEWSEYCNDYANYDNGYGSNEVPGNIAIVFKDGSWLSRWEYDGSEGWSYECKPGRC